MHTPLVHFLSLWALYLLISSCPFNSLPAMALQPLPTSLSQKTWVTWRFQVVLCRQKHHYALYRMKAEPLPTLLNSSKQAVKAWVVPAPIRCELHVFHSVHSSSFDLMWCQERYKIWLKDGISFCVRSLPLFADISCTIIFNSKPMGGSDFWLPQGRHAFVSLVWECGKGNAGLSHWWHTCQWN